MKYMCKQCERTFDSVESADAHEHETGHKVELLVSPTYWGAHLIAH
jgi:hypothetical protein